MPEITELTSEVVTLIYSSGLAICVLLLTTYMANVSVKKWSLTKLIEANHYIIVGICLIFSILNTYLQPSKKKQENTNNYTNDIK